MSRTWIVASLLVLAALAGAALAHAGSPAKVTVVECVVSDADQGTADFRGSMRAVKGTRRMVMRFTLLERLESGSFAAVKTPGLEVWQRSEPGVKKFAFTQRVEALRSGGAYRALVRYRWYGKSGKKKLLHSTRRKSKACRQPAPLPNLIVDRIDLAKGPLPDTMHYSVRVRNGGDAPARDFGVALVIDGSALDKQTVGEVPAGGVHTVNFTGPRCEYGARAVADPDDTVRESAGKDNTYRLHCGPSASGRANGRR